MFEETEWLRNYKILNHLQTKNIEHRQSVNIFWNPSTTNSLQSSIHSSKKSQPSWASLFNTSRTIEKPLANINLSGRDKLSKENTKNETTGHKLKLVELLENKEMRRISKAMSKRALNDSGMSLCGMTKRSEKENKKEERVEREEKWDSYGLSVM
jgi:hypothetical protein